MNMSRYIYINQKIVHEKELELTEQEIKQLKATKENLGKASQKYESDPFAWWQDLEALTTEYQKAVDDWNHQFEQSSINERESRATHLEHRKRLEVQISRAAERDTELRKALSEAVIQGEALDEAHSRLQLCFQDQVGKLGDRELELRNARNDLQALQEAYRLAEAERNEKQDKLARDLYDEEFQKIEVELQESNDAWSAIQERFEKKSIELGNAQRKLVELESARIQLNEVQNSLQNIEKEHAGCKQRLDDQAAEYQEQIAKLTSQENGETYMPFLIENYEQLEALRAEDAMAHETLRREREKACKKSMEESNARRDQDVEMVRMIDKSSPSQKFP